VARFPFGVLVDLARDAVARPAGAVPFGSPPWAMNP
jgi:hypothetical protein